MTTEFHSCGLHCDRPACIKAQRDQMRDEFAHPQVPLTEEEIIGTFKDSFLTCTDPIGKNNMTIAFARAIERKHLIGVET